MQYESGECIGLGSLCVASATKQPPLSQHQQQTIVRLADWIVADIVQYTRARRQRERHRLAELIRTFEHNHHDNDPQKSIKQMLQIAYPDHIIALQPIDDDLRDSNERHILLPAGLKDGLWEDSAYIDQVIAASNHKDTPMDRVVRVISAQCNTNLGRSLLAVATKDFRRIFDDIDDWFIQSCANLLTQIWQRCVISEAISAKETFLRGISHQLRTPIHGILGAAELLSEDFKSIASFDSATLSPALEGTTTRPDVTGNALLYLDTISGAGRELMSTVNSMITLNRWADVAIVDRQYAMHDIDELETQLLQGALEASVNHIGAKPPIFFHRDLPQDCWRLRTDMNLLRDSILPLVVNAVQNTFEGVVVIKFSMLPGTDTFIVDIQDTGCGIRPADQERIFQLYEKVGDHSTGTGLGLTLSTKFAALLRGSIELVSSQVQEGSHFRATFEDVAHSGSGEPSFAVPSSFQHLPPSYYQLKASSSYPHLSSNFAEFLNRVGFTAASSSTEDCFIIFECSSRAKPHQVQPPSIPPEQVAICLVPKATHTEVLEKAPNILCVTEPFSTLKLFNALQEASELATKLHGIHGSPAEAAGHQSQGGLTVELTRPPNTRSSNSDEGYSSMDAITPHSEEIGQMVKLATDMQLDCDISQTCPFPEASALKSQRDPVPRTRSARPLVLIVDDNIVNLRILQMYCKKRGLSFLSAGDGEQAVATFAKHQASCADGDDAFIELILMDLQMPKCDGLAATRQIRTLEQQHSWAPSTVVIVTGQDSPSDREAAISAGADDFKVKPIGMGRLDQDLKAYFPSFQNPFVSQLTSTVS